MFFHAYRMKRAIHFHTTEKRCVNLLLLWFSKCVPFDQDAFAGQMQVELIVGFFLPTSIVSGEKYLFCSQRFNS